MLTSKVKVIMPNYDAVFKVSPGHPANMTTQSNVENTTNEEDGQTRDEEGQAEASEE
jgi:hypothetical protein